MGQELSKNQEALEKIKKFLENRPSHKNQRRHTPIHANRTMKVQGPSQLASLDGYRRPGAQVRVALGHSKAPKRRFNPGDRFEYDGSVWELVYMYRVARNPGVWIHVLAERGPKTDYACLINSVVKALGGGATTERIVFTPFASDEDARQYFWDIPMEGDSIHRTTQQLLSLKRFIDQGQLPK